MFDNYDKMSELFRQAVREEIRNFESRLKKTEEDNQHILQQLGYLFARLDLKDLLKYLEDYEKRQYDKPTDKPTKD